MRILCVSDQIDPLVYSERVRDRFPRIDLVLAAGDLPLEYLGFISSMLNCPLLYVEGNHDLGKTASRSLWDSGLALEEHGTRNMGFRIGSECGLSILGLPGSIRYNKGANQFTDLAMALHILVLAPRLLLSRLISGRAVDIILTHAPPKGIHDRKDPCHRGFSAFRYLIRLARPRWFIHGHVHLFDPADERIVREGPTTVINAYGHWLIDTGETA
ncbi:MAG: metallophosphoesterase [Spirochaetota bacterium]